jgi:Phage terminase-like protein, large subunit
MYELFALESFLQKVERYTLRDEKVRHFITFYEHIRLPSAEGMVFFPLTPVQVFQFTNIFWFYYPDDPDRRVVREVLLFVPRKFSKTTSIATLAVYDLLYGDANAESYVGSNSYQQSQVCFGVISKILRALDPTLRRFKINREQVFNRMPGKMSISRCLASAADRLDGLNASLVIIDEYAQAESDALKSVLTSSMGARRNPLTFVITTASDKSDTPFIEMLEAYKSILRGEAENDAIFAHVFEPDALDEEGDPNTWMKVQPHLGVTVRPEYYAAEYEKAQLTAGEMKTFRNKLLNIFARDEREMWLDRATIERAFISVPLELLRGSRAMCAVDLSVQDDFSAVTFLIYTPSRVPEGRTTVCPFHAVTYYFFPRGQLDRHVNRELYRRWVDAGYLLLCEGESIDYAQIVNLILSQPFATLKIGYDPYKALEFTNLLLATPGVGKANLEPIPQTNGSFNTAVDSFELALSRDQITFAPNPITAYCFANAVIDSDRLENRKPIKATPNKKIDGAITCLMGFWLFNHYKS